MCHTPTATCIECGTAYAPGRERTNAFCSRKCRTRYHNRRMARGAELYDLFMVLRYERETGRTLGLWSLMCRLGQVWRDQDIAERAGRRSYQEPTAALASGRYAAYKATRMTGSRS